MRTLKLIAKLLAVLCFVLPLNLARAQQVDIRMALAAVIQQLQIGQPNPTWYSPQLWQTIALQTGSTGVYPQLRNLGIVTGVNVNQQVQLPLGPVYSMTAQHQFGVSNWVLGVNTGTNRLEYANFTIGGGPVTLPATSQSPAPSAVMPVVPAPTLTGTNNFPSVKPPPDLAPNPPPARSGSRACDKYPDLC